MSRRSRDPLPVINLGHVQCLASPLTPLPIVAVTAAGLGQVTVLPTVRRCEASSTASWRNESRSGLRFALHRMTAYKGPQPSRFQLSTQ